MRGSSLPRAHIDRPCLCTCPRTQIEAFFRGAFANPGLFTRDQNKSRPASESPELPGVLEGLLKSGRGLNLPQGAEVLLDDETLRYYIETFGQGKQKGEQFSLDGGLNWYRTRRINFDDEQCEWPRDGVGKHRKWAWTDRTDHRPCVTRPQPSKTSDTRLLSLCWSLYQSSM